MRFLTVLSSRHPRRLRSLRSSSFFQGTGTDIRDRNVDLELEFDCPFVWTSRGSDDAGVRLCDVISFRLHSRGGACAYPFVMAADWLACRIDFRERRFQLADASANSRLPLAGKNLLVGIVQLGVATITWIIMRTWLKYDLAS